ncbi:MAG: hypothetical protein ACRDI3_04070 [Actinomycetota bacterium]
MRQTGEASDRVEDALAAYLDYLEMGGREPDTSHLTPSEHEELEELIAALELTQGVAFGSGRSEETGPEGRTTPPSPEGVAEGARSGQSEVLLSQLRAALPPGVRIESETPTLVNHVGGIEIVDGWIVGTFGGRVKVWLLGVDEARSIEDNADCLSDLNRVFRMFPDTAAVALVAGDLSCLLVQPEDCAPQISVPSGSLISRRYRRSIQPVAEAVSAFVDELIPYWDPIPAFDPDTGLRIDVSAIGSEFVRAAIDRQRGIGERARKGNPKKDALLAFGEKEMTALTSLAKGLFDGSIEPDEIEARIESLRKDR